MPQRHMSLPALEEILSRLPIRPLTISLQGEGEPMLHPEFWEMIAAVRTRGYRPYTITNGSALPHPERVATQLPDIGVSIDTLDAQFAERIGRLQLDRVLRNLDRLLEHMAASRIVIHTVDMGQPLRELKEFVTRRGMRHLIQPLQRKEDYRKFYADAVPSSGHGRTGACMYLRRSHMRYFNVDGVEMPCCFIKNVAEYRGIDWLRESFAERRVPDCCAGCNELA
jgi:MoaA/NifB/PqqE/SkfB family radical SAM enzyme